VLGFEIVFGPAVEAVTVVRDSAQHRHLVPGVRVLNRRI
jgi:hypothetical protein